MRTRMKYVAGDRARRPGKNDCVKQNFLTFLFYNAHLSEAVQSHAWGIWKRIREIRYMNDKRKELIL